MWRAWLEQRPGGVVGKARLQRASLCCLGAPPRGLLMAHSAVLTWLCTSHLQGIINLGTSENKLCFDLLSRRVSPGAPLGGIPSCKGLSSLGFLGTLPPESLLLASAALGTTFPPSWESHLPTVILLLHFFWLFPSSVPPAGWVPALRGRYSVLCGQYLTTGPGRKGPLIGSFSDSHSVNAPTVADIRLLP